jgi:putative component of membrane protein insertase Oxa1/YidC/SpoIIIJ protein YidD
MLLRLAIRAYWIAWPARWRRACLYRESCSQHVHRVAGEEGFAAGVRALRSRIRGCRPGYGIVRCDGRTWLALADGSVLDPDDTASRFQSPGRRGSMG